MQKIWFIDIEGKLTGPYSVSQLRGLPGITPETLVWREGYEKSVPIRIVRELQEIFEDSETPAPEEIAPIIAPLPKMPTDGVAIDYRSTPPYWILFIMAFVLIIFIFKLHYG